MQNLIKLLVILFLVGSVNAQTTPEPPRAPKTYSSSHSSSVSISKSDDDYRFKARFHKSRYEALKNLLIEELGTKDLKKDGTSFSWNAKGDSFTCDLSKTKLRMYLDYNSSNSAFINKIEELGNQLKYAISGGNAEDDVKSAQEEISRAEAEVARARAELRRAESNLKRNKKN